MAENCLWKVCWSKLPVVPGVHELDCTHILIGLVFLGVKMPLMSSVNTLLVLFCCNLLEILSECKKLPMVLLRICVSGPHPFLSVKLWHLVMLSSILALMIIVVRKRMVCQELLGLYS